MKQDNYKILVLVLRILVGVLGIVCFINMFQVQVGFSNDGLGYTTFELVAPEASLGNTSVVFPLIGYVLFILATVGSIAMIFVKDMLGGSRINKIIDFALAGTFVVGAVLVVLSQVWFALFNNGNDTVLAVAPIVACSCAGVAAVLTIIVSTYEAKL